MTATLADLTWKLSRELSELEARCARQMEQADEKRDAALTKLPLVAKILSRYHQGLTKAKSVQLETAQKANEIRDKEIRAAEEKRSRALALEDLKRRRAKDRALRTRQSRLKKAKARWKGALQKLRTRPLSEQGALRRAADKAYEEAVEAAREKYDEAIAEARLAFQFALQEILVDERLAIEKAKGATEKKIRSAAIAYQRTVAQEEARMRSSLAKHPKARQIQEEHDRRHSAIHEACERQKEALFTKFKEDRRKLKR